MRWVITGLILSGFVFILSGCGGVHGVWHRTDVRNLPDELEIKLSVGDTRRKVRDTLGNPSLDVKNIGVELYRKSGRDIDYEWDWVIYPMPPLPTAGQEVIVFVIVAYDDHDIVKEIKTNFWIPGHSHDFWSTVGGYTFANSHYNEPETILAPPVTWNELARMPATGVGCTLILLMGDCPMEKVSLDTSIIIDLSPAGGWCGTNTWQKRENNFYGTFVKMDIAPGSHRLDIRQKTHHGNFGTNFTCEEGETVLAELKANNTVPDTWPRRLQGAVSISKNPVANLLDIDVLYPIIWHKDKWYGDPY
jgi:hypothetical protein